MKEVSTPYTFLQVFRNIILPSVICMLLGMPSGLLAQTDSTKTDSTKTEEPEAEAASLLIAPSIQLNSTQKANNTIDLKAALTAKVKGTFYKLPLLKVTFVQVTDSVEKVLGFIITNQSGKAVFNTSADLLKTDAEGKLHFKALFAGNKAMDPAEEEITIKRARLEITPIKEDSLLTVKVKLIDVGTGTEIPVPEAAVGIFVKRLFNPLKIGEGTTDTTGEASVEIPHNLPGDTKGNIILLARLDENELYGNLEASVTQQWGTPVSDKLNALPRALWSPSPPIWMLVTFIILMTVVWGHYIVIIIQLFRLRKEGPLTPVNNTKSYL